MIILLMKLTFQTFQRKVLQNLIKKKKNNNFKNKLLMQNLIRLMQSMKNIEEDGL